MAALPTPTQHVFAVGTNQQTYENDCIPPNSKRAQNLMNMRNNLIPEFFQFQVQFENANANTLAFYQGQFPNDALGGLMGSFMNWLIFRRTANANK
jgi:hypothetical protein